MFASDAAKIAHAAGAPENEFGTGSLLRRFFELIKAAAERGKTVLYCEEQLKTEFMYASIEQLAELYRLPPVPTEQQIEALRSLGYFVVVNDPFVVNDGPNRGAYRRVEIHWNSHK